MILDVPVGTIRSRVFRGRESLRKLMDRRPESEAASGAAFTSAAPKCRPFVSEDQPTQNSSRIRHSRQSLWIERARPAPDLASPA